MSNSSVTLRTAKNVLQGARSVSIEINTWNEIVNEHLALEQKLKVAVEGMLKHLKHNDCDCSAEESDGSPVICYLHEALALINPDKGDR